MKISTKKRIVSAETIRHLTQCALYCRVACITINFSEPQILWFIFKSGFKSRSGYNGSCMVLYCNFIILGLDY